MFQIAFTPDALADVAWFRKHEQTVILDRVEEQLTYEPSTKTRNRKRLRANQVAEWELRIGKFRVFYDVNNDEQQVEIKVVASKAGSTLYVQGEEFTL